MYIFRKLLSDTGVTKRYIFSGSEFGYDVSLLAMAGECIGFEKRFEDWEKWEKEYSNRGYKTISLDNFISHGAYNKPIDELINVKRKENEEPVFHSQIYKENYFGINPDNLILTFEREDEIIFDEGSLLNFFGEKFKEGIVLNPIYGSYHMPSTERPINFKKVFS